MKVAFDREKCIGCGTCEALCPKFWKLMKDGRAQLLGSQHNPESKKFELELENLECNKEAAESCPAQCVFILEK